MAKRKPYTMARRNELARKAGFDSYRDRQERQRFFKATGDKSVLPDGFDTSKLRTTVGAIPSSAKPEGSPLRKSMDRLKIKAGAVPITPLTVVGNRRGTVRDRGNMTRGIRARGIRHPDSSFTLTYVVKSSNGDEWTRSITRSGAQWADMLDGQDMDEIIVDDVSSDYGSGSWAGSLSSSTAGSFSYVG